MVNCCHSINIPTMPAYMCSNNMKYSREIIHQPYDVTSRIMPPINAVCNCLTQSNSEIFRSEPCSTISSTNNVSLNNHGVLQFIPRSNPTSQVAGTACYLTTTFPVKSSYYPDCRSSTLPRNSSSQEILNPHIINRRKSFTKSHYSDHCMKSSILSKSNSVCELPCAVVGGFPREGSLPPELLGGVSSSKIPTLHPSPTYINTLIEA